MSFRKDSNKQMLQQEAYAAICSPPADAQNSAIPGAISTEWEMTCPRCGRTAVQNFTPIGKAAAEKSVTVQKVKKVQ